MSIKLLLRQVQHAEQAVLACEQHRQQQWQQLHSTWRASWTPGRLLLAGLASGFILGRARPLQQLGSHGALALLRQLAPLVQPVLAGFTAGAAGTAPHSDTDDAGATSTSTADAPPTMAS